MTSGVYAIYNMISMAKYVGSAGDIRRRIWDEHLWDLRRKTHCNPHLQASFNLYGEEAFAFGLLEECDPDILIEREQWFLNNDVEWDIDYNMSRVAGQPPSPKGREKSEKHRRNLSKSLSGHTVSRETRRKLSDAHRGRKRAVEAVAKQKETMRKKRESSDYVSPYLGRKRSPETTAKIRETIRRKKSNRVADPIALL